VAVQNFFSLLFSALSFFTTFILGVLTVIVLSAFNVTYPQFKFCGGKRIEVIYVEDNGGFPASR
jgi:hypothetical protein